MSLVVVAIGIVGLWLFVVLFTLALCKAAAVGNAALDAIQRERLLEDDEP
jgi:hypothetical protein